MAKELEALEGLAANWDSYGAPPPGRRAFVLANRALTVLRNSNLLPSRIMPSAEGGVVLVFSAGRRYADIECFNDGDMLVGYSCDSDETRVVETSLSSLKREVARLRAFLEADHS